MFQIRPARSTDAEDMAEVQNAIYRAGLRSAPVDVGQIRERYLDTPFRIACTVAEHQSKVVGFQSLVHAWPDNPYDVAEGWGIIGTHIHPDVARNGLGRRLFVESRREAEEAGLQHIDATIGSDNDPALAYYGSIGFTPYRETGRTIPHRFDL